MVGWPDTRFLELTGARVPIVQAPMAGAGGVDLAVGAIQAGALGSLPCALLTPDQVAAQVAEVRARAQGPLNLNFFCHAMPPEPDDTAWRDVLAPYYAEEGVSRGPSPPLRLPFDAAMCAVVEAVQPEVVSFHFGLPDPVLLARVKARGVAVFGNATTPEEAVWLAARGVDTVIAQGAEAGGHAGWFQDRHRPIWLPALFARIARLVDIPVIVAGGLVHGGAMSGYLRGGAAAVQLGTAYLACPESLISPGYRALLGTGEGVDTAFTNLFSGRRARGIRNRLMRELGPVHPSAPPFPYASNALYPLRRKAEAEGRNDYSPLWAGIGAGRVRAMPARELIGMLADEILSGLACAVEYD